jgi:hypothetical protein
MVAVAGGIVGNLLSRDDDHQEEVERQGFTLSTIEATQLLVKGRVTIDYAVPVERGLSNSQERDYYLNVVRIDFGYVQDVTNPEDLILYFTAIADPSPGVLGNDPVGIENIVDVDFPYKLGRRLSSWRLPRSIAD